jgi:hypothetical protein
MPRCDCMFPDPIFLEPTFSEPMLREPMFAEPAERVLLLGDMDERFSFCIDC